MNEYTISVSPGDLCADESSDGTREAIMPAASDALCEHGYAGLYEPRAAVEARSIAERGE